MKKNLQYVISKYLHLNIIPILDYAVENNKSSKDVDVLLQRKLELLNTIKPFHSLKLSSINCCNKSFMPIMQTAKKIMLKC